MKRGSAMRILTFSSMFPSAALPRNGLFVEQRLRRLLETGEIEATVVSPVPWFPLRAAAFGRYARFADVAAEENRDGLRVLHPRYPVIPKVGMTLAPALMAAALRPVLRRLLDEGPAFDLLDAHYFYPDGVAAVRLGRSLGLPVVVTARGSDVNLIPRHRLPRRMIVTAARRAAAVVTVSEALRRALLDLGVPAEQVTVLRNGVDLARFRPVDRGEARRRLDLPGDGPLLLSVGNLIEGKGHHIAVDALARLPEARLVIVGEGALSRSLAERARGLGLGDRVRLAGGVPQQRLPDYYAAADLLVLASAQEGMPNVVLESLACGTPVVATAVGGIPEVLDAPAAGRLVGQRTPGALAAAVQALLADPPGRGAVRRHAERFGWDTTTEGQLRLFRRVLARGAAGPFAAAENASR